MKELLLLQARLEIRKKSIVISLVSYLLCMVFISYLTLGIQGAASMPGVWSALFWIVLLTTAVNTIAKSFTAEKGGAGIYLYTIASPGQLILSKIIYGTLLCTAISLSGFAAFAVLLTNPIQDVALFVLTLVLSSFGFAASLSLLSALSSKTNNSAVVMAVLSFPVTIGIVLMAIRITKNTIDGLAWSDSTDELLTMFGINLIATSVSYLLFPYIWRS